MNNPTQVGSNETAKTQPQSDTKPTPQQDQGDSQSSEKKPQQQN